MPCPLTVQEGRLNFFHARIVNGFPLHSSISLPCYAVIKLAFPLNRSFLPLMTFRYRGLTSFSHTVSIVPVGSYLPPTLSFPSALFRRTLNEMITFSLDSDRSQGPSCNLRFTSSLTVRWVDPPRLFYFPFPKWSLADIVSSRHLSRWLIFDEALFFPIS